MKWRKYMDKYEITDYLLFQHCANAENFILEQIPDEEGQIKNLTS